jgi:hypothetical protein
VPKFLAGDVHSVIGSALGVEGLASLLPCLMLGALLAAALVVRNFPARDLAARGWRA